MPNRDTYAHGRRRCARAGLQVPQAETFGPRSDAGVQIPSRGSIKTRFDKMSLQYSTDRAISGNGVECAACHNESAAWVRCKDCSKAYCLNCNANLHHARGYEVSGNVIIALCRYCSDKRAQRGDWLMHGSLNIMKKCNCVRCSQEIDLECDAFKKCEDCDETYCYDCSALST